MIPDKILYTDGHNVTVTDSVFKVKHSLYRLNGITKHGMSIIRPDRIPGAILLFLGIAIGLTGLLKLIPPTTIPDVQFNGNYVSANTIALFLGAFLLFVGILLIGLVRERYAVRIATAEGEKDVIVSTRKEYISQIVNALNDAFGFIKVNTSSYTIVEDRK